MSISYNKLVASDTFIGRYMAMMQEQETPQAYDFFCALWLMSLAMRGCVVARPRAPVHMNLYLILVAESGITRKSTAVGIARRLARQFIDETGCGIEIVEGRTTPEQFEDLLHRRSRECGRAHAAIAISELVTFLSREKYSLALPGLLTDLYDCPEQRTSPGTVTRGPTSLQNVYISFISASTPAWLARAVSPDVVEGGFTSRCLFIVEDTPKKLLAWPSSSTGRDQGDDASDELELSAHLRALGDHAQSTQALYGGIGINEKALATFTRWYKTRVRNVDPFRASFESREDAHVLRISAYLAANDDSWQINTQHIKTAIKIITEIKHSSTKIFEGAGLRGAILIGIDRLRDALLEAGTDPVTQTKLYIRCKNYLSSADLKTLLEIMHELEMVQRFEVSSGSSGRPATVWRGTKSLLSKDVMKLVMEQYDG